MSLQRYINRVPVYVELDRPEERAFAIQALYKQLLNVMDVVDVVPATFRGSYNQVSDMGLHYNSSRDDVVEYLNAHITTVNDNDYCYVDVPASDAAPTNTSYVDRYLYKDNSWTFELSINMFTVQQWAAINSGVTADLVNKLDTLPEVNDYTSWDSTGTTQGGAGAMVVVDETGYKAILAITSSYVVTNMHVGQEMYIPANAVLDGETLITVYNDPALTTDSGIKVKISAERKATLNEALSLVYYSSRNEANQYTDEEVAIESANQKNLSAIMSLAVDPNAAVTTVTTNPEWKLVYTDAEDRILLGKRQDNTWYFATDLDTILDVIIDGYSTT